MNLFVINTNARCHGVRDIRWRRWRNEMKWNKTREKNNQNLINLIQFTDIGTLTHTHTAAEWKRRVRSCADVTLRATMISHVICNVYLLFDTFWCFHSFPIRLPLPLPVGVGTAVPCGRSNCPILGVYASSVSRGAKLHQIDWLNSRNSTPEYAIAVRVTGHQHQPEIDWSGITT